MVLREEDQFIMFSSDHPPSHVHVRKEGKLAKVRLKPIEFERTGGFNAGEQRKITEIIRENIEYLLDEWSRLYPVDEEKGQADGDEST